MEYFRRLFGRPLAGRGLEGRALDGTSKAPNQGGKPAPGVAGGGGSDGLMDFSTDAQSYMIAVLADDPF